MSRNRTPGRRRAAGRVRRLPDGFSRLGATWALKTVATVSILGGAALVLALPVDARPAASLSVPAASSGVQRADDVAASRSRARQALARATPAVSAPEDSAPLAHEQVGIAGVKAVPRPAPKPSRKPAPKPVPQASPKASPKATPRAAAGARTGTSPVSSTITRGYRTTVSGRCGNLGLINNGARLCSAVDSVFHLRTIGGYRANAGEHGTGQAIDFMISSRAQGDDIAAWVQSHVGPFNVKYVIWRQRYWEPGSAWRPMEDRGSPTANHMDHVHVTVNT